MKNLRKQRNVSAREKKKSPRKSLHHRKSGNSSKEKMVKTMRTGIKMCCLKFLPISPSFATYATLDKQLNHSKPQSPYQ